MSASLRRAFSDFKSKTFSSQRQLHFPFLKAELWTALGPLSTDSWGLLSKLLTLEVLHKRTQLSPVGTVSMRTWELWTVSSVMRLSLGINGRTWKWPNYLSGVVIILRFILTFSESWKNKGEKGMEMLSVKRHLYFLSFPFLYVPVLVCSSSILLDAGETGMWTRLILQKGKIGWSTHEH